MEMRMQCICGRGPILCSCGASTINKIKEELNNTQKLIEEKEQKEKVKEFVTEINNKLFELCEFVGVDVEEIQYIQKYERLTSENIGKQTPFNSPLPQKKESPKFRINRESLKAAGITNHDFNHFPSSSDIEKIKKKKKSRFHENIRKANEPLEKKEDKGTSLGNPPPKTDWERVGLDNSEKNKILQSIKANPKSSVFSPEFKWNTHEFLKPFKYLESAKKYNGPFIVTIITDKIDLEKYSKIDELKEGINNIYLGKYILLSVYDITSSEEEVAYIHIGLNYLSMSGRLEFDTAISQGGEITMRQQFRIKEFMDSMDIVYNEDLKL